MRSWAGRSPAEGASTYAIPASAAAWAASEIRQHGRVSHPFLGVQIQELRPAERERLNAPGDARVRVGGVAPRSPAQEAGLRKDDLILAFQGKKVEGPADLSDQIARTRVGERVSLDGWRDGKGFTLHLTLQERPLAPWLFQGPAVTAPSPRFFITAPEVRLFQAPMPRVTRLFASGQVTATASGTGRGAQVTLEAQDAELAAVLQELSRATRLQFRAEGDAARQRVTLKVERVPVDDLVESLARRYHLRSERQGGTFTFRPR